MHAFILAGGFATRLWPLTEKRAKPLLPLAGKPLISYIVDAIPDGIPITVSTNGAFANDFKAWQKTLTKKVSVSIEDAGHDDQKLGALGAISRWIRDVNIDDDILLLAGDNYADWDMAEFIALFNGKPLIAGHDVGDKDIARRFGTVITDGEGKVRHVTSFEEKPQHPKSTIVSTGFYVLPKATLPVLINYALKHPDNIGGIFEEFLRQNIAIDCFIFTGLWKDIGSFETYLALHREIVGQNALTHPRTVVDKESVLIGSNDLGPKTVIEKSTLTDCIVFGESTIKDCVLERCIIDEHCALDGVDLSDKMLRAGTILKRKT